MVKAVLFLSISVFSTQLNAAPKSKAKWTLDSASALRGGRALSPEELTPTLLGLDEDELIDKFMAEPEFADTALLFNLFFLGHRPPSLRYKSGIFRQEVFFYPAAITAAKETITNGDFLRLLDYQQPLYPSWTQFYRKLPGHPSLGKEYVSSYVFDRIRWESTILIDEIAAAPELTKNQICSKFSSKIANWSGQFEPVLRFTGFTESDQYKLLASRNLTRGIRFSCLWETTLRKSDLVQRIEKHVLALEELQIIIDEYKLPQYAPSSLDTIVPLDSTRLGIEDVATRFTHGGFWKEFPNNETNLNRLRGSEIYKRFFCDDLSPTGASIPPSSGGIVHGEETACQSCHYKLDPMAGFFRNHGKWGTSAENFRILLFDDDARTAMSDYLKNWQVNGSNYIGIIRSTEKAHLNEYGSTMEDLFKIIRDAPEVRQCLVKRMAKYFLGPNQLMDGGYLKELTNRFNAEAKLNSAAAFKGTIKRLLKSKTFKENDADETHCYDFEPGVNQVDRPPCKIAYIFESNCGMCHSGPGARGGLNLVSWDSAKMNFQHKRNGNVLSQDITLEAIRERITSRDPMLQMPKGQFMSHSDRKEIIQWIDETIN